MTTDTLLAFRDKHPEAWPEGLGRTFGQSGGQCWGLCEDPCGDDVAHALIESKVMDAMAKQTIWWTLEPGENNEWGVRRELPAVTHWYPTRLEALIAAYEAEMKGQNQDG